MTIDPSKSASLSKTSAYLIEIGPHNALQIYVKETLASHLSFKYVFCLRRNVSFTRTMADLVVDLFVQGYPVYFAFVNQHGVESTNPKMLVDLPGYPFNHS